VLCYTSCSLRVDTLVRLPRIVTPYRDSVDGTRARVSGIRLWLRPEQVCTCNVTLHVHTSVEESVISLRRFLYTQGVFKVSGQNLSESCVISGFHRAVGGVCSLLGHYAAYSGNLSLQNEGKCSYQDSPLMRSS
jgi:hypothetical protein